jgi:hypothetical protein
MKDVMVEGGQAGFVVGEYGLGGIREGVGGVAATC